MARIRTEDQIFFIFNHQALKCEEDDLKDGIVYFFPTSISTEGQCALVGQLMGLVDFFKSFSASPPLVYKLQKNKVAIKHLGKYTMALSGNRMEPDSVVITQLNYLYNIFTFYFGSLQQLDEEYEGNIAGKSSLIQDIWDCYLPFIRRYGDNVAAAFDSLPLLDLPKHHSVPFLKASHLLEDCQLMKNTIAGCILFKNRVLCSQLLPDVTARLLVIQSPDSQVPCQPIRTVSADRWPDGIKLVHVFVTQEDYRFMKQALVENTSSNVINNKNPFIVLSDGIKKSSFQVKHLKRENSKQFLVSHDLETIDRKSGRKQLENSAVITSEKIGINALDSTEENNSKACLTKKTSPKLINGCSESFARHCSSARSVPSYGRQRSCEFRSSNVVGIEHSDKEYNDCKKDWVIVGHQLSPDDKKLSCHSDTDKCHQNTSRLQYDHSMVPEQSSDVFSHNVGQHSETDSLFRNFKMVSGGSDDELSDVIKDKLTVSTNTSLEASYIKPVQSSNISEDKWKECMTRTMTDNKKEKDFETKSNRFRSPQKQLEDPEVCFQKENDLIKLNLYIQGVADTLLFLFLESDALTDDTIIDKMFKMISPHLDDLDVLLSELSAENNIAEEMPLDYNYLTYNGYTKNLAGQISMSAGLLQPLSHDELDFCGTAIAMHDEFEKSPGLVDITIRNQTSCVYCHKAFSQEVYFQPKHCKPPRGISPARNTVMCLGDVARQSLLVDRDINIPH